MSNLIGISLGRYHILEQIGEGGMATVYKAHDTRLEADVAVKVIRTENLAPNVLERALKRFEREAKTLARLTHPNIVKVMDFGEYKGKPYLVLEYLPGGTLKQRLGKPIPWQEAFQLILPIARALDFAHRQNMIHRDVKPSNILITADGEPMLTDFGIAKVLNLEETADLTGTGMGIGTPKYMAPEQWQGNTSTQSDLYSLGVVLYEMITGRKPYTANTPAALLLKQATEPLPRPSEFVRDLPDRVEKILIKALTKEPKERFKDVGEFIKALDDGLKSDKASNERPIRQPVQTPIRYVSKKPAGRNQVAEGTYPTPTATPHREGRVTRRKVIAPLYVIGGLGIVFLGAFLFDYLQGTSLFSTTQVPHSTEGASLNDTPVSTFPITSSATPAVTLTTTALPDEIVDEKGISMRLVPAGEFTMGSNNGQDDERPEHLVYLDSFYMDTYEVTNSAYKQCIDDGVCDPPSSKYKFENPSYAKHPVVYVNWFMAKAFCEWRGARLPTEAEWEKAARGTDGRTYPWGEELSCDKANYRQGNLCIGETTLVGSYERGISPYGIYDMAGNVEEWVNDWYSPTYYQVSSSSNPSGPGSGQLKVRRGGAWALVYSVTARGGFVYSPIFDEDIRSSARNIFFFDLIDEYYESVSLNNEPSSSGAHIGYRCAKSFP